MGGCMGARACKMRAPPLFVDSDATVDTSLLPLLL
jgi:hypothetical protein